MTDILGFVAHPDDETMLCGTIAHLGDEPEGDLPFTEPLDWLAETLLSSGSAALRRRA